MYNILRKDFQIQNGDSVIYFQTKKFEDKRGYFMMGIVDDCFTNEIHSFQLKQQNISFSYRNTLRGMHYQIFPKAQAKIVSCINGAVIDFVMDIREDSPYKGQIKAYYLEDPQTFLYVPTGFAHGFMAITETVLFQYFVDNYWDKEFERSLPITTIFDKNITVYSKYNDFQTLYWDKGELSKYIISDKDLGEK